MKKRIALAIIMLVVLLSTTSCYFNSSIGSNEVGLLMDDGVSVTGVVGPGRYTNMGWYAGIMSIDTSSRALTWTDNDVWTSDKQSVGFGTSVTYARMSDEASVRKMWKEYNGAARDDRQLEALVLSRIPRIVKEISTTMTLDEMLGIANSEKNRSTLQNDIENKLSEELASCGVQLIDFGINSIAVDPSYQAKLTEKANAAIEIELAEQKSKTLEQQLVQEKAQTEIDLEKARRANLVAAEEAKVFEESEEAYELERLKLLTGLLGDSDKIYFIPEGTDITLFLGGQTVPGVTGQ